MGQTRVALFAIFALAVIGGIAYVHQIYSPGAVVQNSNAVHSAPLPVAPASSTAKMVAKSKTCTANDMSCFIAAAQNCSPANMEWAQTTNILDIFIQTSQVRLAINGFGATGKCSFSERTDGLTITIPSAVKAQMKAQGVTDTQINQQIASTTAAARQQSVGVSIACALVPSSLVKTLTNWSKGSFSTGDLSSGNCISTLPNGTKIPLYTGGSIPLAPSGAASTVTPPSDSGIVTEYLSAGEVSTINSLEFKVNAITADQLNVTVTDTKTGQNQTVSLAVNDSAVVLGHAMTVTDIKQVSYGTVNGQPTYTEQATVNYK